MPDPSAPTQPAEAPAPRRRLVETSGGTISDAFGATEWGLLSAVAVIYAALAAVFIGGCY